MVKFIQKNGNCRRPVRRALRVVETMSQRCSVRFQVFQFGAVFAGFDASPPLSQEFVKEKHSSDSLQDLMDSIRKIEQKFSDYGIEIEVRLKPSSSH
jgi:hypothetical protein